MPNLEGAVAVVTGANSGIGLETARELARKGATVVMAARNAQKNEQAWQNILASVPGADLVKMRLDLADLASVREFADEYRQRYSSLHLLINNAGVMAIPQRTTADGFEMQFGTNHLGHFALTGLLLELLLGTLGARVVTVSSAIHQMGSIPFDDLQSKRRYSRWGAYATSKLANLLFAFELQRRLEAIGARAISVAAHPGYASTNLQHVGPEMDRSRVQQLITAVMNPLFAQSAVMGALPTLYAATAPDVRGGDYIGPGGLAKMRGYPIKVRAGAHAHDTVTAQRLWMASEELTGVQYALGEGVPA
jgi:NAD(P)-dependent dehydrogenase (short-subunit alcohol dehydrogenase family)